MGSDDVRSGIRAGTADSEWRPRPRGGFLDALRSEGGALLRHGFATLQERGEQVSADLSRRFSARIARWSQLRWEVRRTVQALRISGHKRTEREENEWRTAVGMGRLESSRSAVAGIRKT